MRIIGIDAGYSRPGVSVVDFDGNTLDTKKSTVIFSGYYETSREAGKKVKVAVDDARRIKECSNWLIETIRQHRPDLAVVEMPLSGGRSALAIKGMAMAAGYTVAVLTFLEIELQMKVVYYSPYDTKRACTGDPHAEKDKMIAVAKLMWPNVKWPMGKSKKGMEAKIHPARSEAVADSLCAILAHIRLHRGNSIL